MNSILLVGISISSVRATWTCEECTTITAAVGDHLSGEGDIQAQLEVILAEVCPAVEDVDGCLEGLPGFWKSLAPTLWSETFKSELWCGDMCPTQDPGVKVTCEECTSFVDSVFNAWTDEKWIQQAVDIMSGPAFCDSEQNVEECQEVIAILLPLALPVLATHQEPNLGVIFCNWVFEIC